MSLRTCLLSPPYSCRKGGERDLTQVKGEEEEEEGNCLISLSLLLWIPLTHNCLTRIRNGKRKRVAHGKKGKPWNVQFSGIFSVVTSFLLDCSILFFPC